MSPFILDCSPRALQRDKCARRQAEVLCCIEAVQVFVIERPSHCWLWQRDIDSVDRAGAEGGPRPVDQAERAVAVG